MSKAWYVTPTMACTAPLMVSVPLKFPEKEYPQVTWPPLPPPAQASAKLPLVKEALMTVVPSFEA